MSRSTIIRDLNALHPFMEFLVRKVLFLAKSRGLKVAVFETRRTLERQQQLKERGFSKIIRSYHLYGLAADIVFLNNKDRFSWAAKWDWDALAQCAEECGLASGWRWKTFKDGPHMQLEIEGLTKPKLHAALLKGEAELIFLIDQYLQKDKRLQPLYKEFLLYQKVKEAKEEQKLKEKTEAKEKKLEVEKPAESSIEKKELTKEAPSDNMKKVSIWGMILQWLSNLIRKKI